MKSILYVGATLMIGASVYGFVDYNQANRKKEFSAMYQEEKTPPVVAEEEIVNNPAIKHAVSKEDVKTSNNETEKKEVVAVADNSTKKKVVVKKAKKKKKLDHRIFSRAPLKDEELRLPEPVKTETKKIEDKEQ